MIAQPFFDEHEIAAHSYTGINKNIVNTQNRRNTTESTAQSAAFFNKGIVQVFANGMVSIAVGYVVKIAGNNNGVWTLFNFCPYPVGLNLSF